MKFFLRNLYLNKPLTTILMFISQLFERSSRVVLSNGTIKDNRETIEIDEPLKAKYKLQYLELTLKNCSSNFATMLSNPLVIDKQGNEHNLYVTLRTREGLISSVSPSSVFTPTNELEITLLFQLPTDMVPLISAIDVDTSFNLEYVLTYYCRNLYS